MITVAGVTGKIDQSDYKKQALNFVKILSFLLALFLSSRLVGSVFHVVSLVTFV